jgi:hypothetical protein
MRRAFLILTVTLAGPMSAESDNNPTITTTFSPYIGISYGFGSRFVTADPTYSGENLVFSGLDVDLGGRLTLTSGGLHAYAQVDFINLNRLFPLDSSVAFMITQSAGWSTDFLTLEASFRYARTFNRQEYRGGGPMHEVFGGCAEARQYIGRVDYGVTLGLVHRNGILARSLSENSP